MGVLYWEGKRIRLRAVEPSDWEIHFTWDQDVEAAKASYFIPFPRSSEATRRWAEQSALQQPEADEVRLQIETISGVLVGTINSHHCDPRTGTFSYGIAVRPEHQRKGYASEAVLLFLRYFFNELRYQKVTVQVYEFNQPSIRLHEKLGFIQEGRLRRLVYTDGKFFDVLCYGLTVEEFRAKYGG
jgi:RimJ/RimL family protein N-acetyltransferase